VNQGRPPVAASQRPGEFTDHAVPGREAGGTWQPPAARGANPARPAIHPNDLPPVERSNPPYTGNTKLDQKYQQQQEKLYNNQVQQRQKLQQQQDREAQKLTQQNANANKVQEMNQRHQQQTQNMQQREVQQRQSMQQKQQSHR